MSNSVSVSEIYRLFVQAWKEVLRSEPTLQPTFDETFPGFYSRQDDVGIALSGEYYVVGHMDAKGGFVPSAGPFNSAPGAVIAAVGMVANSQASKALSQ
jgi:hypothetical protein